jgi:dTDP-4-dehydrorhamnose reductase
VRAWGGGIAGHAAVLRAAWKRYRLPVAITELHLGCTREEQMRWLLEAWTAAHAVRAEGADVRAVTVWALLGSYDWNSLLTRDAGHYEPGAFDVRAPEPRPTALAGMMAELAAGRDATHPVLDTPGWWRRPERYGYRRVGRAGDDAGTSTIVAARPILIVGTLDSTFARICGGRGLACMAPDLDAADTASVRAALERFRPWAVVSAVESAVLASGCARIGVQLLTATSDFPTALDLLVDEYSGTAFSPGSPLWEPSVPESPPRREIA